MLWGTSIKNNINNIQYTNIYIGRYQIELCNVKILLPLSDKKNSIFLHEQIKISIKTSIRDIYGNLNMIIKNAA